MGIRRLPDDLDRLLDALVAGEEPEATGDLASYLHPARVARAAFVRSLDDDVAQGHLAELRADRARNVLVVPPARNRRFRFAVAGLVSAAFLFLGGGTAIGLSSSAIPGNPLYGVKRAAERISLAMHRDPVSRANLHLQFANNRLQEVAALTLAGKNPQALADDLEAELDAAEHDALQAQALGKDADAILTHVQDMILKHLTVLTDLLGKVPDQAKDAIQHAIDNAQNAQENVQHGRNAGPNKGNSGKKPTSTPGKQRSSPGRP